MDTSVVAKGKTVSQAVDVALDLLGATKQQVNIEVIEPETKSLLGLKAKPAVVRVTMRAESGGAAASSPPPPAKETAPSLLEVVDSVLEELPVLLEEERGIDVHGKVWVKNGVVRCKDAPGTYLLVTLPEGCVATKNKEPVAGTVPLKERDELVLEGTEEVAEPEWSIRLDDRRMKAILTIAPGAVVKRRWKDAAPAKHISLTVEEERQPIPIDRADIHERLQEMGVIYGVDDAQIAAAAAATVPGTYIVASGKEPLEGKHGFFQALFPNDADKAAPKERADGTMDFREMKELLSVAEGELLGLIRKPIPGRPGEDVTGEKIPPPVMRELELIVGAGVTVVENGTKVLSTQAGMPQLQVKGHRCKISIVPKLLHGRDVDLASGNLHFQGDIEVTGTVQDGMLVQAEGQVVVLGNVNMAQVRAARSVIVQKNIISSQVNAGEGSIFSAEAGPLLKEIVTRVRLLKAAVQQVLQATAFKQTDMQKTGLRPLLQVLMQGKFKSLHTTIGSLHRNIQEHALELDEEWETFGQALKLIFLQQGATPEVQDVEAFEHFILFAEQMYSACMKPSESSNECRFQYSHNSEIYSSGSVHVQKGCYNTKLHCNGVLRVEGFLRGGEYTAGGGAVIKEAGTVAGVVTRIAVPEYASIRIQSAMEDTLIRIGVRTHKFTEPTTHVHARLDEQGNLKLY